MYFHQFVAPGPAIPRAFGEVEEFRPFFPPIGEHYYDPVVVSGLSLKRDQLIFAMEMVRAFSLDYLDYDICVSKRDTPYFEVPRMANALVSVSGTVCDFNIGNLKYPVAELGTPKVLLDVLSGMPITFSTESSDKVWITLREYDHDTVWTLFDTARTRGGVYDPQTRLYYNGDGIKLLAESPFTERESADLDLDSWKFAMLR